MAQAHDPMQWTVPAVLKLRARETPEKIYLTTEKGEVFTYADAAQRGRRVAGFLSQLGVAQGDAVAVLMSNGAAFVDVWLGLATLGAVMVPINTALAGSFLEHQLKTSSSAALIVDERFRAAAQAVVPNLSGLRQFVVASADVDADLPSHAVRLECWKSAPLYEGPGPSPSDIGCIIFTSGTTGPSKGVLMPHAHCYLLGFGMVDNCRIDASDRVYVAMPLFHANGLYLQLFATMIAGATAYLRERFSASEWLSDVRRLGSTVTNMLGAMASFVFNQPPSPEDRTHDLRVIMLAPNPPESDQIWHQRFGVPHIMTGFGMTECNMPIYSRIDQPKPGTAGYVWRPYFEAEVHDPVTDFELEDGKVGELVIRPRIPGGFMAGYCGMPEATVKAWRNLWFHTGDAAMRDRDGVFTFIDRLKDSIRRRGENISSYEIESAIASLEGVQAVAAFAVPADGAGAEDEVMLAVLPFRGSSLSAAAVASFATDAIPRFAQPRYIDIVDELPCTPTGKIRKDVLRQKGVTDTTWDRAKTQ